MYTKKNTRVTFRSNKRPSFKRNNYSSNKPRNKGNVTQQYNKYLKMAKEAFSSGDRIQSEYYYQFTDHYYRIMLELGINIEDNDLNEDKLSELDDSGSENINLLEEKKEDNNKLREEKEKVDVSTSDEDIESIESIPFISKPAKKKSVRIKKVTA